MNDAFVEKNKNELGKAVTVGILLEYTNDFLIPAMSDLIKENNAHLEQKIKENNAQLEHNLKSYIDDKLSDQSALIFKKWREEHEREKDFKRKVVELFKRHKIGTGEEIAFLEGFVQAI